MDYFNKNKYSLFEPSPETLVLTDIAEILTDTVIPSLDTSCDDILISYTLTFSDSCMNISVTFTERDDTSVSFTLVPMIISMISITGHYVMTLSFENRELKYCIPSPYDHDIFVSKYTDMLKDILSTGCISLPA